MRYRESIILETPVIRMLKYPFRIALLINFEVKQFLVNYHTVFEDEYSLSKSLIINKSDEFYL